MTSERRAPNDLFAAVASFFVPGLGQFLAGQGSRAVTVFVGALVVWWLPSLLVGVHLAVTGAIDPISEQEAHAAMRPLSWAMRFLFHLGAAYDAFTIGTMTARRPLRRPPGRTAPRVRRRILRAPQRKRA